MTARTLLTAALLVAALPASAGAADIAVTSTADGAGSCAVGSPTCTVRQALLDAKALPGRDVVRVPAGQYDLTGADLIIAIGEQVDVVGPDPRTTVLREVAGGDGRVFLVEQDASLHLQGLTLTGSRNASAVLLFGGGNDLRATDVVFTGNTAARGAAIDATSGAAVVLDGTTVHGNTAAERGGGVRVTGAASTLAVQRSTLSGNAAPVGAAVAVAGGSASFAQATVAGGTGGTDLDVAPGASAQARASVLGGCAGGTAVTSLGFNVDAGAGCGLAGPGDRSGIDPQLGPLADAGGLTPTRVPLPGSPLLDADPGCPPAGVDQRGIARPQGAACDIGAVELAVAPAPPDAPPAVPPVSGPGAPRLTQVTLTPSRFRTGPGPGRGTRITLRSTAAATLRLRVERAGRGRRTRAGCRAPGRAAVPAARRCTRWVLLPGAVERRVPAGRSGFRFRGRVAGRTLPRGRYRLVLRARRGTVTGPAVRRAFSVR